MKFEERGQFAEKRKKKLFAGVMEFRNNSFQNYIDPKHIFCVCVEVFEFDSVSCLFFACGILLLFNAKKKR